MQAWVSLIHASTYLRRGLETALQEGVGLSLSEQDLVKQLHVNGGALGLTELSKRIYLSKAGVTRMLDRLEDAGLVERRAIPGDRRSLQAVLTSAGTAAFKKSKKILRAYVDHALGVGMSKREVNALKNALQSLLQGHGVWDGQQRHLQGKPGEESE